MMPYVEGETLRARLQRECQLSVADITMVNLETTIAKESAPAPKQFHFRAPATALDALAAGGVDGLGRLARIRGRHFRLGRGRRDADHRRDQRALSSRRHRPNRSARRSQVRGDWRRLVWQTRAGLGQ